MKFTLQLKMLPDEKQYAMVGATSGRILQLGDEIYVTVKNADLVKKQLDFNFIRRNEIQE